MNINNFSLKIVSLSYKLFCKIYQKITTFYENNYLRISFPKDDFSRKAIFQIPSCLNDNLEEFLNWKSVKVNRFLYVRKLSAPHIKNLINYIFTSNVREKITAITGFNFSVDFIIFYDRKYIPLKDRQVPTLKQPYSYRWHFDKPNSSNMLKIFVPINIESESGPLEAIYKYKSKSLNNLNKIDSSIEREFFLGNKDIIFGFYPTLCCHRDGIPNEDKTGTQIMFQLNPNKKWVINKRLFSDNSSTNKKLGIWTEEPKFPFFSYFFDERLVFDN